MSLNLQIHQLRAGDYIPDAAATVAEVECFGPLAFVTFTDGTCTAPMPAMAPVRAERYAPPPVHP